MLTGENRSAKKNLSHCHVVHRKSHTDWSGNKCAQMYLHSLFKCLVTKYKLRSRSGIFVELSGILISSFFFTTLTLSERIFFFLVISLRGAQNYAA